MLSFCFHSACIKLRELKILAFRSLPTSLYRQNVHASREARVASFRATQEDANAHILPSGNVAPIWARRR